MRHLILVPALALTACKVIDAPDDLEALVVYGFVHFTEDDDAYQQAAAEGLIPYTSLNRAELETGYRVDNLTVADLAAAGVTSSAEIDILGAAATTAMTSSLDDIAWVVTTADMTQVQLRTVGYEATGVGDVDCFLAHACDTYSLSGTRSTDTGFFGVSEQDFSREWRWITLQDGTVALVQRELAPTPARMSSSVFVLQQQYAYSVFFPEGTGTRRMETLWVDARLIGMDVPDTWALDRAVEAMQGNAGQLDAYIAENR